MTRTNRECITFVLFEAAQGAFRVGVGLKWGYGQEWRKFLSLSWTTFFEKSAFSVVLDILSKKNPP